MRAPARRVDAPAPPCERVHASYERVHAPRVQAIAAV